MAHRSETELSPWLEFTEVAGTLALALLPTPTQPLVPVDRPLLLSFSIGSGRSTSLDSLFLCYGRYLQMQNSIENDTSFLVDRKNNCNSGCGRWSLTTRIPSENGTSFKDVRMRCKQWSCPRCGPKRAKQVRYAITQRATELGLTRMLTLTIGHDGCTAGQSVRYIRECWSKLRVYLRRKFGESITYICILEFQLNGYAHLHILVDRYIDFGWIQANWQAVGGGYRVSIDWVDAHRIGAYLSKYLTKELMLSPLYGRYRRFTTSQSLELIAKSAKGVWFLIKSDLDYLSKLAGSNVLAAERDPDNVLQSMTLSVAIGP